MKFLLDENAELRLAASLREAGHDVTVIAQDYPHALQDRDVLELARREQRILITNDTDFGELIVRDQIPHAGVILFRLPLASSTEEKIAWLQRLLDTYSANLSHFVVVTPRRVRVRVSR